MPESASSALGFLFIFSVAMFTLPFIIFFAAKDIAEKHTSFDQFGVTVTSVVASVATVNIIIILYVCRAIESAKLDYHEERLDKMD